MYRPANGKAAMREGTAVVSSDGSDRPARAASINRSASSATRAVRAFIPSFDALNATLENAARLRAAGAIVVLSSFDTYRAGTLRQEVGNAIANGMAPADALEAVTLAPARVWGVADRIGSLEPGKDADVVVWSGDPFELTTHAEQVFIRGREMPKTSRQTELLTRYK